MSVRQSLMDGLSGHQLPKSLFGYEIIDILGKGAASHIYVASHPTTHQLYALKHVVCKNLHDDRFIHQLDNEHKVGQKVNHPVLRRSIEIYTNRKWLYQTTEAGLVLELFDGAPLDISLPDSLADTLGCFIKTAGAVQSLHAMGIIHCDLKPNNILINAEGDVKVIDLGQACPIGTRKERIQGTPDFMAPEQVTRELLTVRTDVFNFGATLYWALCQRKIPTLYTVQKGENSFLMDGRITPPHEVNSLIPDNLSHFVMECIHSHPAHRPSGMSEIIHRLELIQFSLECVPRRVIEISDTYPTLEI